jgi:hypothetical protein
LNSQAELAKNGGNLLWCEVAVTAGEKKKSLEFIEELLLLVQWPADGHRAAVDDETQIEHVMKNVGVPFYLLS